MNDRHGRAWRGDGDPRRRPQEGFRVRDPRRFARLLKEATSGLDGKLREACEAAHVVVADVPDGSEPRCAAFDAAQNRLVVYRRPLEARATSRMDLVMLTRAEVAREIAEALGLEGWDNWGTDSG